MAKRPTSPSAANARPADQTQRPASADATLAAGQTTPVETDEQREAREKAEAERKEAEAKAPGLADEQRKALLAGEDGREQAEALKGENETAPLRHSISDPAAVPVDFDEQTLRRPPQVILPSETPLVVNRPYGSDARSVDPATGLPPVPEAPADEDEDA